MMTTETERVADAQAISQQLQELVWLVMDQTTATCRGVEIPWTACPHVVVVALTAVATTILATLIQRDAARELPRALDHLDAVREALLDLTAAPGANARPS